MEKGKITKKITKFSYYYDDETKIVKTTTEENGQSIENKEITYDKLRKKNATIRKIKYQINKIIYEYSNGSISIKEKHFKFKGKSRELCKDLTYISKPPIINEDCENNSRKQKK